MNKEITKYLKVKGISHLDFNIKESLILIESAYNLDNTIESLNYKTLEVAYYYFFIKNDIEEAKQYFYLSGKLLEYEVKKLDVSLLSSIGYINNALLSDNVNLINSISILENSTYELDMKNFLNIISCIQAIIRDDWNFLKEQIIILEKKILNTRGWKKYQPDLDFFTAILEKNPADMLKAIMELAGKYHKKRNDNPLYQEIISIPALLYAKLAYLKGYKLNINHPLIPMELLTIEPNSKYWKYDFMKKEDI